MSYKMKLNDETLSVFKTLSTMCPRLHVIQDSDYRDHSKKITNLLHYDEENLTIIYRAQIFDSIFDDIDAIQFELVGLKQIMGDIAYLKKEIPEFIVDDGIKSIDIKHSKGKMKRMFSKLMEEKHKHDEKIRAFTEVYDTYVFQLVVNEKEFTHFKKRVMSVDGVTSHGYVQFACDNSETFDVEFKTKDETVVKECYKVVVTATGKNKESSIEHELYTPVEETQFNDSFELKIQAKDLNKVKATSKADINIGFMYKASDNSKMVNKVEFKETKEHSETSVFVMKMKEDNAQ